VGEPDLSILVFYSVHTEYTKKLTPVFAPISIDTWGVELEDLPAFVEYKKESNSFIV
jgi:hypothetical protein